MTHMEPRVGVRELRQNLSQYLKRVKAGEGLVVTERGREVARMTPSGPRDSTLARLAADRGATLPLTDLAKLRPRAAPATGPPSGELLGELREERL
jgi:prevent-host-death family protein